MHSKMASAGPESGGSSGSSGGLAGTGVGLAPADGRGWLCGGRGVWGWGLWDAGLRGGLWGVGV